MARFFPPAKSLPVHKELGAVVILEPKAGGTVDGFGVGVPARNDGEECARRVGRCRDPDMSRT